MKKWATLKLSSPIYQITFKGRKSKPQSFRKYLWDIKLIGQELLSKIYKELLQKATTTDTPILKLVKNMAHITQKLKSNCLIKHFKTHQISLIIEKMFVKHHLGRAQRCGSVGKYWIWFLAPQNKTSSTGILLWINETKI